MKTRSSGPSSRPPLSWVGGIACRRSAGLIVPVASSTSRTSTLPVESWTAKAPSSSRTRSAETVLRPATATESSHRAERPAGRRARAPSRRSPRTSDATKTASGSQAAVGPGWPKPHVTVSPHASTTTTITTSAATSRPDVRPASRPTHERHEGADALAAGSVTGARSGSGRSPRSRSAGSRASSSLLLRLRAQLAGTAGRGRRAIAASPSARTRWDTADGLMPSVLGDVRCGCPGQQTTQHRQRALRQAGDPLVAQHQPGVDQRRRPGARGAVRGDVRRPQPALRRPGPRPSPPPRWRRGRPTSPGRPRPAAPVQHGRRPQPMPCRMSSVGEQRAAGPAASPARPRRRSRRRPGTRRRR